MGKNDFKIKNTLIFHDYYSRLKMIALSMYKWVNLPATCNERFLENTLFENGMACFVCDDEMSFLNLKATPNGDLNPYNEPLSYHAYSFGYSKTYDSDNIVIVRNNPLEKSTDSTVLLYAERLARIQIAMDLNIDAQKTPILIRCDDKTKTSLETVYNQYQGGKPVIVASKSLAEKPLDILRTDAPFVVDKLREEKRAVWNEFLEFLGINTNPSDSKRERLIVNEVDANNEQIEIQQTVFYSSRKKACEDFKNLYGIEIDVVIDYEKIMETVNSMKEGGDNGRIHD